MAKTLPPLNWFRAFEASARRLSFTAAAEEIGMTQSAVSQQIRSLEARLQVALFERHARGLALTDEGRKLLPQVESALETLATATGRYDTAQGGSDLVINASISVTEWVIAPALDTFSAAHPDLKIRFLTSIWPDEFAASRADVEIRFGSARQVGAGAEPILPNDLVALKSPGLNGAVTDLPLIEAVGTSTGWAAWGKAAGLGPLEATLFVDSYGLALQLAATGNGVALASSVLAGHALQSGQLVPADPHRIPGKEGYFLSVNPENPAASAFGAWLSGIVRKDSRLG